jgi:hypothetical protein
MRVVSVAGARVGPGPPPVVVGLRALIVSIGVALTVLGIHAVSDLAGRGLLGLQQGWLWAALIPACAVLSLWRRTRVAVWTLAALTAAYWLAVYFAASAHLDLNLPPTSEPELALAGLYIAGIEVVLACIGRGLELAVNGLGSTVAALRRDKDRDTS